MTTIKHKTATSDRRLSFADRILNQISTEPAVSASIRGPFDDCFPRVISLRMPVSSNSNSEASRSDCSTGIFFSLANQPLRRRWDLPDGEFEAEIVIFCARPRHASASGGSLQALAPSSSLRSKLLAPSSSAPRSKLLAPSSSLQLLAPASRSSLRSKLLAPAPRSKLLAPSSSLLAPRSSLLASSFPAAVIRFDMHVDVSHSRHFDQ